MRGFGVGISAGRGARAEMMILGLNCWWRVGGRELGGCR